MDRQRRCLLPDGDVQHARAGHRHRPCLIGGPIDGIAQPAISPIPEEVVVEQVVSPSSKRFIARRWSIMAASAAVILILAVVRWIPSSETRAFNRFWTPILDSHQNTLIYVGGNRSEEHTSEL